MLQSDSLILFYTFLGSPLTGGSSFIWIAVGVIIAVVIVAIIVVVLITVSLCCWQRKRSSGAYTR